MDSKAKWKLTQEEKDAYIAALTKELPILRAKAGISQEDLAKVIGISRQNYGWIERGNRKMSWGTYLSLVFFFDYNQSTHKMIRSLSAFPAKFIDRINKSGKKGDIERIIGMSLEGIGDILDEQALHAIRTLIMVEYARCRNLPGDAVIKSFDGRMFAVDNVTSGDVAMKRALNHIKRNGGAN